jgi:hypothetical protein
MSGQANILEELVAQFKLKDSGAGRRNLNPPPRKQIAMPEHSGGGGDYGKY